MTLPVSTAAGWMTQGATASSPLLAGMAGQGLTATGSASLALGGGTSALGALGAIAPWALGAIGLYSLFNKPKPPVIRKDMANYDRQNDLRSQADRMYSPMFMSGYGGSSSINPQQAYTQQYTPTTQYSQYSNLGMSGFGRIKGFGGMGGGINPSSPMPVNNTNWTGFTNPLTNYGSANTGGGIKGLQSIDGRTQGYNKRQSLVQNSMAGYQLRP